MCFSEIQSVLFVLDFYFLFSQSRALHHMGRANFQPNYLVVQVWDFDFSKVVFYFPTHILGYNVVIFKIYSGHFFLVFLSQMGQKFEILKLTQQFISHDQGPQLICSYAECINIYKCYIFLFDQSLYYYITLFFVSYDNLHLELLSDTSRATPAFLGFHLNRIQFFIPLL